MRYQGRITSWKDDKGYGFITPNGGGEPVFTHIRSFSNRLRRPSGGELVTYELGVDAKGRLQANAVAFVAQRPTAAVLPSRSNAPFLFTVCFLALVVVAFLSGRVPVAVPALYLGASLVTFLAYAFDKSAALRNQWRTPERTLHLLALAGGWPGAFVAQRLLRHKSAKASFQISFWLTVLLNCGALGGCYCLLVRGRYAWLWVVHEGYVVFP